MRPAVIGIVVVALSAVLLFASDAFPGRYHEASNIAEGAADFEEIRARFKELAEEKGGVYAFEVLKRAELPPNSDLHLLGHTIGDVLYEQKGIPGIVLCTQDFRNACSHSVVIGALLEFGESALEDIRDACKESPGGSGAYTMCYHGLGHGVYASFDYSLPETIDFCKKTGSEAYRDREYIECVGGAIMELTGGGGHNREAWLAAREMYFDDARPLAPCTDAFFSDDVRAICLNYLTPRLWELAGIDMGNPEPWLFPRAFAYCDELPRAAKELREACYGGFGKEFFPLVAARDIRDSVEYTDEQLGTIARWCALSEDREGSFYCIHDAVASAFWGGEKNPDIAFRLCALSGDLAGPCFEHLGENIKIFTSGATREQLCARLPVAAHEVCREAS